MKRPEWQDVLRSEFLLGLTLRDYLLTVEKDILVSILDAVGHRCADAARICGMTREGMWKKLRFHGLTGCKKWSQIDRFRKVPGKPAKSAKPALRLVGEGPPRQ